MIRATFDAATVTAATSEGRRRIDGIAVPWGVPGRVSDGTVVVFEPGSLDATARPVALLDHDRTRPIGRVTAAADDGAALSASVGVNVGPLGDQALIDAAPPLSVRGMFSVGAEPRPGGARYDPDGVLHVSDADWQELSLLTLGAYQTAVVTHVAAASPTPEVPVEHDTLPLATDEPVEDEPTEPTEPNPDIEPDEPPENVATVPVQAARGARRGRRRYADVTLAQVAAIIQASRGGSPQSVQLMQAVLAEQGPLYRGGIEAALADITLSVGTDNIGQLYRPAYQRELVDLIDWGTPLINALRQGDLQRGDWPSLTFNTWEKAPTVALNDVEKTAINSTPVKITPQTVTTHRWAGGNDISQIALDLGSPSFVADYVNAAGVDYARKIDTYAVTTLLAAATDVPGTVGISFIDAMAALVGGLSPATTPPGGLFLCMSYDLGVGLIGVPQDKGPAFWDGSVSFGAFTPSVNAGGLSAFVDPNMPASTYLLGHRQGATWYDLPGTPFTLQAVNVGLLGLDVAVYGYGALGVQYPGSFTKMTVPAGP